MAAGTGETTGRKTRGSAPETRVCGPGRTPPHVAAGFAAPDRGHTPFRPRGGRMRGCGSGAGSRVWAPFSGVFRWQSPGGRRRQVSVAELPVSLMLTHTFAELQCRPRSSSADEVAFLGRDSRTFTPLVRKVWNLQTENGRRDALPRAPRWFRQSRRCLRFLRVCPDFSSGSGSEGPGLSQNSETDLADGCSEKADALRKDFYRPLVCLVGQMCL